MSSRKLSVFGTRAPTVLGKPDITQSPERDRFPCFKCGRAVVFFPREGKAEHALPVCLAWRCVQRGASLETFLGACGYKWRSRQRGILPSLGVTVTHNAETMALLERNPDAMLTKEQKWQKIATLTLERVRARERQAHELGRCKACALCFEAER